MEVFCLIWAVRLVLLLKGEDEDTDFVVSDGFGVGAELV